MALGVSHSGVRAPLAVVRVDEGALGILVEELGNGPDAKVLNVFIEDDRWEQC